MSRTNSRTIHCDGHGCGIWSYGAGIDDSFAQIRAQLKKRGWRVNLPGYPGGRDLCSACPD